MARNKRGFSIAQNILMFTILIIIFLKISQYYQKLTKIKPATVAQASRISGVSPADISVLLVYMGR